MSAPMDTVSGGSARTPEAADGEPIVGDATSVAESASTPSVESGAVAEAVAAADEVAVAGSVAAADVVAVAESGTAGVAEGLDDPSAPGILATSEASSDASIAPEPVTTADVLPFPTPESAPTAVETAVTAASEVAVASSTAAIEPEPAAPPADTATPAAAEPPTPPTPPTPGQRLRAARAARELGVQQITDTLHIEPRLIVAMESDDFAAFDAPVYARGFLRKYADFLGVPVGEVLAGYERLHAGPSAPSLVPTAGGDAPPRDWSFLKLPAMVAGVLVLVGGSAWWWMQRAPDAAAPRVDASVAAPAAPVAGAAAEGAPANAETTPAPQTGDVPVDVSLPGAPAVASGAVGATPPDPSRPGSVPGIARTTVPAAVVGPMPARPSGAALEIDFVGDCWVEVTGPTGARLMYDLGRPGESRALPGPGPWRVFLGAADGARLRVSGRPVIVPTARRSGDTARLVVGPDGTVQ
jgi:cytoskeleton protein RodZ